MTFDLELGVKVTQNDAQYHLHQFSLYIFYCHKLQQWGWVTSSRNISYDPPPTYTDQSKYVNMATKHIFNYTKS